MKNKKEINKLMEELDSHDLWHENIREEENDYYISCHKRNHGFTYTHQSLYRYYKEKSNVIIELIL